MTSQAAKIPPLFSLSQTPTNLFLLRPTSLVASHRPRSAHPPTILLMDRPPQDPALRRPGDHTPPNNWSGPCQLRHRQHHAQPINHTSD
ncbi:hypothetical protein V6N13_125164 [Hibiscus sabdariffa]|uniref:Uncharacterized protein n=1 Tax=Hibiscus sabdariffa TaxID=183260 RepID=A0ABR2U4W2_9ROSI